METAGVGKHPRPVTPGSASILGCGGQSQSQLRAHQPRESGAFRRVLHQDDVTCLHQYDVHEQERLCSFAVGDEEGCTSAGSEAGH